MSCERNDNGVYALCAITDRAWLDSAPSGYDTIERQVEESIAGGATMIQLREKDIGDEEFGRIARSVKLVTYRSDIPLIINDNLRVALECDADGLHIGQTDGSAAEARRSLGEGKLLGISVQTVDEAIAAENAGADYVGVGAMFPTSTKDGAMVLSLRELADICAAVSIPVLAIGGITAENAPTLAGTGISGIAVISAIFSKGASIRQATEELRRAADLAISADRIRAR